jgi:signal transduction histidine kinase
MEQSERMTSLIRQLLDYARRSTGHTTDVDLGRASIQTVEMLEPLARARGVSLVVAADASSVVRADAAQLQQVLTNLVMNGIQAMPTGGRLEIRSGRGEAAPPGGGGRAVDRCWLRITDEGPGIAPADCAHIFEPFFTTKAVGEGTGLGLAVAQAIVEEHGGRIEVASEPGRGATFTVSLPPASESQRLAS